MIFCAPVGHKFSGRGIFPVHETFAPLSFLIMSMSVFMLLLSASPSLQVHAALWILPVCTDSRFFLLNPARAPAVSLNDESLLAIVQGGE